MLATEVFGSASNGFVGFNKEGECSNMQLCEDRMCYSGCYSYSFATAAEVKKD